MGAEEWTDENLRQRRGGGGGRDCATLHATVPDKYRKYNNRAIVTYLRLS